MLSTTIRYSNCETKSLLHVRKLRLIAAQVNLMDLRRCQGLEGLLTIRDTKLPSSTTLKLTCNSNPERKGHHPKCIRATLFLVKGARKRAILTSDGLIAIRNNFTIVKSAKFLVPVS